MFRQSVYRLFIVFIILLQLVETLYYIETCGLVVSIIVNSLSGLAIFYPLVLCCVKHHMLRKWVEQSSILLSQASNLALDLCRIVILISWLSFVCLIIIICHPAVTVIPFLKEVYQPCASLSEVSIQLTLLRLVKCGEMVFRFLELVGITIKHRRIRTEFRLWVGSLLYREAFVTGLSRSRLSTCNSHKSCMCLFHFLLN